ncbi:Histone deacetylase domain-containing protein [Cladophialophora immunda]|nr:Histone deacetylase domain-containing protein [Cladophialophora immunda]
MDPDIPTPSIEHGAPQDTNGAFTTTTPGLVSPSIQVNHQDHLHAHPNFLSAAAQIPLPPSSPMRSPYHTPAPSKTKSLSPKPPSRSPSVASSYRGERQERQSTPTLATRRSTSSLSNTRGSTPQYRRASSNLNPLYPAANGKMSLPERPPVTASSVAKEYFGKELEAHISLQSPVVVIVHDSCYGHRFSRPRTSKNALATIVERPERIHATLLGASAAYVRLGGRHADGEYAPCPKHEPSRVCNIPFQIRKTSRNIPLNHPSVGFVHGSKWMEELQIMCDTAEGKLALNGKELVRPIGYGKDENGNALPKLHEGDLYLCAESLAAFQGCLGGVCDAVDTVFSSPLTKRAFVCIRPPGHHCSSNYPSGFCWLNNVHVGIAYAAMNHGLTHATIIDFDLHHGDGSQNIAWNHNRKAQGAAKNAAAHKKTPIGYYSLHDINSYPCEWGDEEKVRNASLCIENAHGQSIWNVHLEPWTSHDDFWKLYESKYMILLDKARLFLRHNTAKLRASGNQSPKAAIFISAGFDASEWEGAGMQRHSVNVPTEFYARFTADIVRLAHEDDLGVDGRIISVLEGGYSDRALTSGVLSHICGMTGDNPSVVGKSASDAQENRFQTINNWVQDIPSSTTGQHFSYSANWWALQNLEELEAVVAGRQPPASKAKDKTGNYSSPTQASTLKMTENAREKRSLSALHARLSLEAGYEPPPPDVDWAIASYELSRVIIPSDRQTLSCTHEELNVEATRVRRERPSAVGLPSGPDERMQLRDRKPKAPPPSLSAVRAVSRNGNRRTTIAAVSDLPDPNIEHPELPNGRMRRRSSDASSILSSFQGMKLSDQGAGDAEIMPKPSNVQVPSRAPPTAPGKPVKAVAVKKTRAPPVTKAPIKPKSSPRRQKTVQSSVTGLSEAKTSPSIAQEDVVKREPSVPSQDGRKELSTTDEMDNLTNGLKKISIKLKMPTGEEHASKQNQKMNDDKQKKPRAPRKPLVPKNLKPAKTTLVADPGYPVNIQTKLPQDGPRESFETPAASVAGMGTSTVVTQAVEDPIPDPGANSLFGDKGTDMPPPYMGPQKVNGLQESHQSTTPGPAVPVHVSDAQAPINNPPFVLPPQSSQIQNTLAYTTSSGVPLSAGTDNPVQRTKQDLPVFTSSSPIPFAVPTQDEPHLPTQNHEQATNQQASVWEIPEILQPE